MRAKVSIVRAEAEVRSTYRSTLGERVSEQLEAMIKALAGDDQPHVRFKGAGAQQLDEFPRRTDGEEQGEAQQRPGSPSDDVIP
ncbi:MAG: hypothetical protein U0903_22690 [Planctomycetales bacterium]